MHFPIVQTLSREDILNNEEDFLLIAADIEEEYWTIKHFLVELTDKWRLSIALWENCRPVGYAILSRKSHESVHLHHLMIAPNYRNRGLGRLMAREIEPRAKESGAQYITLKTPRKNANALRFYRNFGYQEMGLDGDYLLLEKALIPPE